MHVFVDSICETQFYVEKSISKSQHVMLQVQ